MSDFSDRLLKMKSPATPVPAWAEAQLGSPKPSEPRKKKGKKMGKKKEEALRKVMAELGITGSAPAAKAPPMALPTALSMLKNAAEVAEAQGDHARAAGIRQEVLVTKMQVSERARSRNGVAVSRMGPGSAELFKTGLNSLPDDDKDLGYR